MHQFVAVCYSVAPSQPVKQSLNQLKATNVEKSLATNVPAAQPTAAAVAVVHPLTNIHVPINSVKPGQCVCTFEVI